MTGGQPPYKRSFLVLAAVVEGSEADLVIDDVGLYARHDVGVLRRGTAPTEVGLVNRGGMTLLAYNLGQGGRRDGAAWLRRLEPSPPDVLFVQESRDPEVSWLPELRRGGPVRCLWETASSRWGTALCVRSGRLAALPVPQQYHGRLVAAVVEDLTWPVIGRSPVVAISIHAPTAKGSTYIKEVGRILDFAREIADDLPLILGGDFNVAVALRRPDHPLYNSPGERALLARMQDELSLVPCWQTVHPGEDPARTLRWMHRADSLPYHCDGLFVPAAWRPAFVSCEVLEDEGWSVLSDHNPVLATFASDSD